MAAAASHLEPVLAEDVVVEVLLVFKGFVFAKVFDLVFLELGLGQNGDCFVVGRVALKPAKQVNSAVLGTVVEHLLVLKQFEVYFVGSLADFGPEFVDAGFKNRLDFSLADLNLCVQ